MNLWLNRAGSHGEYENEFLTTNRVYATWSGNDFDMSPYKTNKELAAAMAKKFPEVKPKALQNWASQLRPFVHDFKKGDLVVVPLKNRGIQIGEITGDYRYDPKADPMYRHSRPVKWVGENIPRTNFSQDLLYSFGAFMTICQITRNDAAERIAAMRKNGWKTESQKTITQPANDAEAAEDSLVAESDLETLGQDRIARLIRAKFKGHGLTRLVDGILRAQGYTTFQSPEGADGGADILAGSGPLGFGSPRICVEVKSGDAPIDRPTVDKLLGAVQKFGADSGLFVSWSGFKTNVPKELAPQFFRLRLWDQSELLAQLFANYDKLDEDLKAELPLKRIWTVVPQDEE